MKLTLSKLGYQLDSTTNVWSKPDFSSISYSDGDEVEQRIAAIIKQASDLTVLSTELRQNCTDWPSLYHLSSARANILRPFESSLHGNILEIGAGCGAITRYLGECNGNVLALEGSARRAAIARSRTRDLPNVAVVADNFQQFQCNQQFDIITLIGVLEYANLFISHGNPALSMLQCVRSLLKPEGKLIIAIENQLGLKYFAGAPEDHFGKSMYGIEGRYRNDQPQTYGRQVLSEMLKQAGFLYSEFMAPFPDYKLPVSIVTEKGFSHKGFDAAALAWQCVKRDPQLPLVLAFAPELVWPSLVKNDVALDLSNSFLIVAGDSVNDKADSSVLAWHFTTERSKEFCKVTRFLQRTNRLIETYCYPLSPDSPNHGRRRLLTFGVQEKAEYVQGRPLSQELIHIVTRDDWRIADIGNFFKQYLEYLVSYAYAQDVSLNLSSPESKIPGEYFDLIPQNIIIDHDGKWKVIDQEWILNQDISLGWLLFRAIYQLIHSVTRFGICADEFDNTPFGFIKAVFEVTGFVATEAEIESFVRIEFAVQEEVAGIKLKVDQSLNWLRTVSLQRQNLNQAVVDRDGQITKLGHTIESLVVDRDFQKAGFEQLQSALTQLAHERDVQIAGFNQAVAERDEQIAKVGHTVESLVIDRDFQKAGFEQLQSALTQLAHERDVQIAGLNQIVSERDKQIASLNQAKIDDDQLIAGILNSISWKLTKPLRFAGRLLRGDWIVVRASIDSLRKTKENPFSGGTASSKNNVLLKFDTDKPQNKQNKLLEQVPYSDKRILLVSYYCPSRAHAGGLRILDIYSLIKSEFPTIGLDLYTCRRPEIDWSYDDVESIFDNIYYSETEDLSVEGLLNQCKERPYYSVIDLQFHQSAKHIDAFRAFGARILFTPIESLARYFLIDVKEAIHHLRGIPFKNIAAGMRNTIEEVTYCLKADEVICVSKPDATVLRTISLSRKIGYMESGLSSIEFKDAFSESSMELTPRKKENIIVYVAFFGSQTNILAMKWYLDKVHPLIKKKVPNYMLHVVGRGDLSVFAGYQDEAIIFVGAVPSVGPYINEAKVGIAPALGGSGLRGKMSQYGLYGVPTVASPIAVKGSAYEDGVDIYITEIPEIFAERCIMLLKDEETNKRIGNMARQTALRHYTWESKLDIIRKVYALDEVVQ